MSEVYVYGAVGNNFRFNKARAALSQKFMVKLGSGQYSLSSGWVS